MKRHGSSHYLCSLFCDLYYSPALPDTIHPLSITALFFHLLVCCLLTPPPKCSVFFAVNILLITSHTRSFSWCVCVCACACMFSLKAYESLSSHILLSREGPFLKSPVPQIPEFTGGGGRLLNHFSLCVGVLRKVFT